RCDLLLAGRDVLVQPLDGGEGALVQQVEGRGELADLLGAEEGGVAEFDLHCSCAPVGCGPPVACHERVHQAWVLVTRACALTGCLQCVAECWPRTPSFPGRVSLEAAAVTAACD